MVRVQVAGVALDGAGQHVILLSPETPGDDRVLPIWIGAQEATAILIAVEQAQAPRPLAHDLMRSMLDALDGVVERVDITRVDEGTFYAEVAVRGASGTRVLDARPSDAVALASRTAAPVFVAEAVLDEAGVSGLIVHEDEQAVVAQFQRFLDDVDPNDFRG